MKNPIDVVAGVYQKGDKYLLTQRPTGGDRAGRWEFPGGKIDTGEFPHQALVREWAEELASCVGASRPLINVTHCYQDKTVHLHIRRITEATGEPKPLEGQAMHWFTLAEMRQIDLTEADRPAIKALALPSRYAISPTITVANQDRFLERLGKVMEGGTRMIQLRDVQLSGPPLTVFLHRVTRICHQYSALCLWNSGIEKPCNATLDGLHMKSLDARKLNARPIARISLLGVSCHTLEDLEQAQEIDADFVVLSPIKATRSHPEASPLGFDRFRILVDQVNIPAYALGGLGVDDLDQAWQSGGQGVAGISGFWDAE